MYLIVEAKNLSFSIQNVKIVMSECNKCAHVKPLSNKYNPLVDEAALVEINPA